VHTMTKTSTSGAATPIQGAVPNAELLTSLKGLLQVATALQEKLAELGKQEPLTPDQLSLIGTLVAAARPLEKHYRGLKPVSSDLDTSLSPRKDVWSRLNDFVAEVRVSRTLAAIRSHAKEASDVMGAAVTNASHLIRLAEGAERLGLKIANDARVEAGKRLNDALERIVGFKTKDPFFSVCVMDKLFPTERPAPVLGPHRDGPDDAYGPNMYGGGD
jgi:hypothetical protein